MFFSEELAPPAKIRSKRQNRLLDLLLEPWLKGRYMDNFKSNNLKQKEPSLYDLKKPRCSITYAS